MTCYYCVYMSKNILFNINMYIRNMKIPRDFKTFIIYGYNNSIQTNIYGFSKKACRGHSVLDGLKYIKQNYDNSLIIPNRNYCHICDKGICLNCLMNINGNDLSACLTDMTDKNIIYPISPKPDVNSVTYNWFNKSKDIYLELLSTSERKYCI